MNSREQKLCISHLSEFSQGPSTWTAVTGLSCWQQIFGEGGAEREAGRRELSRLMGTRALETQVSTAVKTHATQQICAFCYV